MKKGFFACITAVFLGMTVLFTGAAETYRWYTTRNREHRQAIAASELKFVEQCGGYYIDHTHNDENRERVVYLTFDAGYENGNVAKVLQILHQEKVPAAFFVLKHFVTANPDLIEQMQQDGHLICNHTAHHKNLSDKTAKEIKSELDELEDAMKEMTGKTCAPYFRPPEGSFSRKMLQEVQALGYKTVFWSFAYADWDNERQMAPDAALARILDNIHNGAVLLLHPTSATNAAILGTVIERLRDDGYRFGCLDELCGENNVP